MNPAVTPKPTASSSIGDAFGSSMNDLLQVRAALDEHSMVCTTDSQGCVTYANNRFCEVTGYKREEWLGQDYRMIDPGCHTPEFLRSVWQTISLGSVWRGEIQGRARDGSGFWVASTIIPVLGADASPREYLAVCQDITEHKKLHAEMEVRQQLQHLLADLSTQFVALADDEVDNTILRTLKQIGEFMELDRATLWQIEDDKAGLQLTHHWQRDGVPLPPERFQTESSVPWAHGKLLAGDSFHFAKLSDLPSEADSDMQVLRHLGSKSLVCIPLLATTRPFGALVFATVRAERTWTLDEITELKLVAQIIANVVGRRRAEERAEQLRVEIAHSARASMLGELAAALAHELNQPLTAILSNAQAGRRFLSAGAAEPEEVGAILDDIVRDGRRAGGVVHNLRAMLSNASPPREDCSLNEIIHEVAEFLHSELVVQGIELEQHLEPDLPPVHAVRVEMQQILVNLLVNAVQSMREAPAERRRIDIRTRKGGTKVTVEVRDHGCGIPIQHLSSIFHPFVTTKQGGLGMGLSICRRMIEAHSGFIAACNHEDGGAVLAFSLPIADSSIPVMTESRT